MPHSSVEHPPRLQVHQSFCDPTSGHCDHGQQGSAKSSRHNFTERQPGRNDSRSAVRTLLKAGTIFEESPIAPDKLTRQLALHAEDGDIAHDARMKITKGMFRGIEDRSVEVARQLAITFQRFVTGQPSFGYAGVPGSACSRMFSESRAPEARSNFTLAALLVATGHNRWGVMEVFASMIESIRDDADAQRHWVIPHKHTRALNHVESYGTRPGLHAVLRRLFPAQSVSDSA